MQIHPQTRPGRNRDHAVPDLGQCRYQIAVPGTIESPHAFLNQRIRGNASLCYFNYRQSGERIGRALIGLDFPSPYERDALLMTIPRQGEGYRLCESVDEATRKRLLGS